MSENVRDRTGVAFPKLRRYLLNEKDAPKHAPVDPKLRVGSKEQRIAEGKYKALQAAAERRLGKLRELPIVVKQTGQLSDVLTKSKESAERGNFIVALKTLEKANSTKLKDDGRTESKKLVNDAKKRFPAVMQQGQAIDALLSKPDALFMSQKEATDLRGTVKATLEVLFQNGTEEDGKEAADALTALSDKIGRLTSSYEESRKNTIALDEKARKKLDAITTKLPPETLAPMRERCQNVATLMAQNEWTRAEQAIAAVADDIDDAAEAVTKREKVAADDQSIDKADEKEWQQRRQELPAIRERLTALVEAGKKLHEAPATASLYMPYPDPALGSIGKTFKTLLDNKAAVTLGKEDALRPGQALEAMASMVSSLEAAEKRVALLSNPKFAKLAELGQKRVSDMVDRVDTALGVLRQALGAIEVQADPVCKPFEDERDLIRDGFRASLASAKSGEDVNLKDSVAALLSLSIRIDDLSGDDRALGWMINKTETESARTGFAAELKRAQEAVDVLTVMNPTAADGLRGALGKIEMQASRALWPAILNALADKAGEIAQQASKEATATSGLIDGLRGNLTKALAKAQPLVETFNEEVAEKTRKFLWIKGDNQEEKFGGLRDFLSNTLREQLAALDVDSLEMLTEATAAATKLAVDAKDALDDLHGEKPKGSKGTTLDTHADQLAVLKKSLKRSVFASYGGESAAALIGRIDEASKTVTAMPLQDGRKAIMDIIADYDLLSKKVSTARNEYNAWLTDVKKAEQEADAIADDGAAYRKQIKARIEICKTSAHKEDGLGQARSMLTLIRNQIAEVVADPAVRASVQDVAQSQSEGSKDDAKVWKSRYDLGIKRAKEVAGMLTKNRSEIRTLLDQANTLFKQTGDFDLAMSQLDVAMARADYIEKNPEGVEITRRKNLPSVEAKWREKLGGMNAAFDALVRDHVAPLDAAAVPDDVKAGVKNAAAEASALFNPAEFETTVKTMTDPRRSIKDKLAERERALRRIETLLAHFEGNPLLRQLQQNPFDKDIVHAGIASSRFALLDMQNNLLGCMPKHTYD